MSSELARIRAAAALCQSFPPAVAQCVRYLFDHGATVVRIEHKVNRPHSEVHLVVDGVGAQLTPEDMDELDRQSLALNEGVGLAFVHHARALGVSHQKYGWDFRLRNRSGRFDTVSRTEGVQIVFNSLGEGDGVNSKQDCSAKRLVRELSRLLSPVEAFRTCVVDESGEKNILAKGFSSAPVDGFKIDLPQKMIGFGREGLVLKFGAVRVPIGRFLDLIELSPDERQLLNILTHPWLHGVVEVTPDLGVVQIPVPTRAADNFDQGFFQNGHAATLARAIAKILPDVVLQELGRVISTAASDYARADCLDLNGSRYTLVFVTSGTSSEITKHAAGRLLWQDRGSPKGNLTFFVDPSHQVFRTIGPGRDEIMQVIWWQLAMWIEGNVPDVFTGASSPQDRTTKIYLALREQNPERWDE